MCGQPCTFLDEQHYDAVAMLKESVQSIDLLVNSRWGAEFLRSALNTTSVSPSSPPPPASTPRSPNKEFDSHSLLLRWTTQHEVR